MPFHFHKSKKIGSIRLTLGKKGLGWSIGNKYIGYSHGASGRKSLRASIPGTGISYITQLGGKSRKRRSKSIVRSKKVQKIQTTQEAEPMPKKKGIVKKVVLGAVGLYFGSAAVVGLYQGITGTGDEPKTEITMEAETEEQLPDRSFSGTFAEPETEEEIEKTSNVNIVDRFIENYNASAENLITNITDFDVADKTNGHYRTEYRLGAFSNAYAKTGKIGDSQIDVVNYGWKNDSLRIYVTGLTLEQAITIIEIAAPVMDPTLSAEKINEIVVYINEHQEANGKYYGNLGFGLLPEHNNTYELMINAENISPETEPEAPSAVDSLLAGLTAAITDLTETEQETTPEKTTPETEPEPETEKETAPPETKAPETKMPETKKPETKAPETKAPETKPPETKAPETKAPETEPPKKTITITHADSSLSPEMVEALEGVAAFWAPTGTKIHLNPFCRHFQGTVYAGTVAEANSVKDGGWCGTCSKNANENTKTNVNATPEVIADCYSYQDYLNQIPAEFFGN